MFAKHIKSKGQKCLARTKTTFSEMVNDNQSYLNSVKFTAAPSKCISVLAKRFFNFNHAR